MQLTLETTSTGRVPVRCCCDAKVLGSVEFNEGNKYFPLRQLGTGEWAFDAEDIIPKNDAGEALPFMGYVLGIKSFIRARNKPKPTKPGKPKTWKEKTWKK